MSIENLQKIATREIRTRRRGQVQLAGLSLAIVIVLVALVTM